MWGTVHTVCKCWEILRFIPTHVGNGNCLRRAWPGFSVHPHACGERANQFYRAIRDHGSSPRMWGTGQNRRSTAAESRFIPTHVGNGYSGRNSTNIRSVHPHACGERLQVGSGLPFPAGSSPRMWGTGQYLSARHCYCRFIPTHVGNGSSLPSAAPG